MIWILFRSSCDSLIYSKMVSAEIGEWGVGKWIDNVDEIKCI